MLLASKTYQGMLHMQVCFHAMTRSYMLVTTAVHAYRCCACNCLCWHWRRAFIAAGVTFNAV